MAKVRSLGKMLEIVLAEAKLVGEEYCNVHLSVNHAASRGIRFKVEIYVNGYGSYEADTFEKALVMFQSEIKSRQVELLKSADLNYTV